MTSPAATGVHPPPLPIGYEAYVKFSLEGVLQSLDEQWTGAEPAGREEIARTRASLLANHAAFIELAAALEPFSEALFTRVFPGRSRRGELFLRARPKRASEVVALLDAFAAYPAAYRPGTRFVFPWSGEPNTYRIFPYRFVVQVHPGAICHLWWYHACRAQRVVGVRMQLPNELTSEIVDVSSGILRDRVFLPGLSPYVYTQTNEQGRRIGLRFPRAFQRQEGGGRRLLGWRDIPLLRDLEQRGDAPEPELATVREEDACDADGLLEVAQMSGD